VARHSQLFAAGVSAAIFVILPVPGSGAEVGAPALDGRTLGLGWMIPFAGLLLSIALLPLLARHFWHRHHGKVSAAWAIVFLAPFTLHVGVAGAVAEVAHMLLLEYVPFILLLFALFTVAGGVRVAGQLSGSPASNTAILAFGTLLASIVGTTGASILLIRPLISANRARGHKTHIFVFFIFLVSNIGGALSPLGDPPLFLGFLEGVSFFWPTVHLLAPMLILSGGLVAIFFLLDRYLYRRESPSAEKEDASPLRLEGKRNLVLLIGVIGAVLMSGVWHPGISVDVLGTHLRLEMILRDAILVTLAVISLRITHATIHQANGFSWFPILEVAKLFAGLFITIIPAIAILRAGTEGALATWIGLVTAPDGQPMPAMYFWMTGLLSSALDNAPTYLMFFNMAGGNAEQLMGPLAATLVAISAGAVFMGANTYVGNAPNFMVKSICEQYGIRMPSFFGYMLWSFGILTPLYLVLTFLFFR
jgi:Na+/H+ antiporter NhaD/arsenite permease-like protein